MKSKTINIFKYSYQILILICLIGCQEKIQEKKECLMYSNEKYLEETTDSVMVKEAFDYQEILLKRFGETSVKGLTYEAYHLQFYSSHGYGKSVKFENNIGGCFISVKCKSKKDWFEECKEYQIEIEKDEWREFEKMIYEFNFWTAEDFRRNEHVLDGFAYLLEGNRPEAKKCNKKTYQLIARGSPRYDKIGALCDYILEYEDQLKFKYEQMKR